MSHLYTKEELLKYSKYLDALSQKDTPKEVIDEIYDELIPRDSNGKMIFDKNIIQRNGFHAAYLPYLNTIQISVPNFDKQTIGTAKAIQEFTNIGTVENLIPYYKLFALFHELEHGFQFTLVKDRIPFEHTEVKQGYNNIITAITKSDSVFPNPVRDILQAVRFFISQKNRNDYILERNASVEALNDLVYMAEVNGDQAAKENLTALRDSILLIGYKDDNKGCMYRTHKDLRLLKKYNKIPKTELSEENRLRFGLEIQDETREELLSRSRTF